MATGKDLPIVGKWLAVVILMLIIIVGIIQVLSRYIFQYPILWAEEIMRWAFCVVVFIGAAMAHKRNEHMRVGDLLPFLPLSVKRVLDILSDVIIAVFLIILLWVSVAVTITTWNIQTVTLGVSSGIFSILIPISVGGMLIITLKRVFLNHRKS